MLLDSRGSRVRIEVEYEISQQDIVPVRMRLLANKIAARNLGAAPPA